jgi:hypothetical protein
VAEHPEVPAPPCARPVHHGSRRTHRSIDATPGADGMALPEPWEQHGIDVVGHHDLDGRPGFELALQQHGDRWYPPQPAAPDASYCEVDDAPGTAGAAR